MLAWISAVLFALAAIISGANLRPSSAVLSPVTLTAAGLMCLALYLAGAGRGTRGTS